jgi:hypothetical protein
MDGYFSRQSTWRVLLGAVLLLLGIAFLLHNFYVIDIGPVWRFWPLIIVALGLSRLLQAETPLERRRGFWWTFIGLWLFVSVAHVFGLSFHDSWPILLIGWGISLVWRAVTPQSQCGFVKE